jgi:hypothetical protein
VSRPKTSAEVKRAAPGWEWEPGDCQGVTRCHCIRYGIPVVIYVRRGARRGLWDVTVIEDAADDTDPGAPVFTARDGGENLPGAISRAAARVVNMRKAAEVVA